MELPNIAAYAYQDVHVWSALLTYLRPPIVVHSFHCNNGGALSAVRAQCNYFGVWPY